MTIGNLLQLCGLAHIGLVIGSSALPKLLDWKAAFAHSPLLIKQMFWTYAGYILGINLYFGIISLTLTEELLSGSGLAVATSALIALYWLARLVIQFAYFDKSEVPEGWIYTYGEWAVVALFVLFSAVYSYIFYLNLSV